MNLRSIGILVGACATAVIGVGCTSLLGDYTSSDVGGPNDGGIGDGAFDATKAMADGASADDSSQPEDGAITDAGANASDGSVAPLACTTWRYASPIVLETLSAGTRRIDGDLRVFALPNNEQVRIVAGKSAGFPFTIYTVDSSQTAPVVAVLNAPVTGSQSFTIGHRGPISAAPFIMLATYGKPAGGTGTFYAYAVPDTMAATGPLPNAFPIYNESLQAPNVDQTAILPFSTTEIFAAITVPSGAPATYSLGVGLATPTAALSSTMLAAVATSAYEDDLGRANMFHATGSVYIFDENDETSPGLSTWKVADTALVTTALPMKRAIESTNPAFIVAIGENVADTANPSANIMYEETTVANSFTNSVTFRAGTIPYSATDGGAPDLDTWMSTDLKKVNIATNVYTTPVGVGTNSIWVNDNIMLVGPGLKNGTTGFVMPGLNAVWVDSTGTVRSVQTGSDNLLSNLDDFTNASAAPISIGKTSAKWAVAFVETKTDDAGQYDVIEYNELDCQPEAPSDAGADAAP